MQQTRLSSPFPQIARVRLRGVLALYNSLIKDGEIPAGTRETILVLHHPAPLDLAVMNFTTPLQAMITREGGRRGRRTEEKKIKQTEEKKEGVCLRQATGGCV